MRRILSLLWESALDRYFAAKAALRLRYLKRKDPFIYK
jgi:hypothetical protein